MTDNKGRILVTSRFGGTIDIDPGKGTTSLTAIGYPGGSYLSILDSEGKFVSAKSWGSFTSGDKINGIGVDYAGNAYMLDAAQGDGTVLTKYPLGDQSASPPDLGTVQPESISSSQAESAVSMEPAQIPYQSKRSADTGWVITWGASQYSWANGVDTDPLGNIFVTQVKAITSFLILIELTKI